MLEGIVFLKTEAGGKISEQLINPRPRLRTLIN